MAKKMKDGIPSSPTQDDYAAQGKERPLDWVCAKDPIALFQNWLAAAEQTEPNDPNAMSLATIDSAGCPDVRIVLLKGFSEEGFVFYTNENSAKGQQLLEAGKAALCFHWKSQKRQVRVRGPVSRISDAESDSYFARRARDSRIGAWASDQSAPAADREELLARVKEVREKFDGADVPRPAHWYGWRLEPRAIEFWQDGAFRLHDRILFSREDHNDSWTGQRLFP